jgi:hypothetical protein
VNHRQNWKSWDKSGKKLHYQVIIKSSLALLARSMMLSPATLIITISDTSKKQPKRLDSDNKSTYQGR